MLYSARKRRVVPSVAIVCGKTGHFSAQPWTSPVQSSAVCFGRETAPDSVPTVSRTPLALAFSAHLVAESLVY